MVQAATHILDVYQSRNPKASAYYKCVENHFEEPEPEHIPELLYDYSDPQILAVDYWS
jgi:hypothetical protein